MNYFFYVIFNETLSDVYSFCLMAEDKSKSLYVTFPNIKEDGDPYREEIISRMYNVGLCMSSPHWLMAKSFDEAGKKIDGFLNNEDTVISSEMGLEFFNHISTVDVHRAQIDEVDATEEMFSSSILTNNAFYDAMAMADYYSKGQ